MPRINGRVIRPANLSERRLLLSLGSPDLRVPRGTNPFVVARRLAREARSQTPDLLFVREVVRRSHKPSRPRPSPDTEQSQPAGSKHGPVSCSDVQPPPPVDAAGIPERGHWRTIVSIRPTGLPVWLRWGRSPARHVPNRIPLRLLSAPGIRSASVAGALAGHGSCAPCAPRYLTTGLGHYRPAAVAPRHMRRRCESCWARHCHPASSRDGAGFVLSDRLPGWRVRTQVRSAAAFCRHGSLRVAGSEAGYRPGLYSPSIVRSDSSGSTLTVPESSTANRRS